TPSEQPRSVRVPQAALEQGIEGVKGEAGGRVLGLAQATAGKAMRLMPSAIRGRAAEGVTEAAKPVALMLRDQQTLNRIGSARLPPGTAAPSGRFVPTAINAGQRAARLGEAFRPDAVAKALGRDPDFVRTLYQVLTPAESAALDKLGSAQAKLAFWKSAEQMLTNRLTTGLGLGGLTAS